MSEARGVTIAAMPTARQAIETHRRVAHAMGADPYGVRTLAGARAAYVRGDIEIEEFERRVEMFLREAADETPAGRHERCRLEQQPDPRGRATCSLRTN
jgi:hypothetical protein